MSSNDTWMPLYIGDYLADTMHLSAAEHGAYLLLLMHHWRSGPLPNDDKALAAIARTTTQAWVKVGPVVRGFFQITDAGVLVQKRLLQERAKADDISVKRGEAGKRGAAKRWKDEEKEPSGGGGGGGLNGHKPMANAIANATDLPEQTVWQTDAPLQSPSPKEVRQGPPFSPPAPVERGHEKTALPDWVPSVEWAAWEEFRASQPGKRWSPLIRNLSMADLDDLRRKGNDPAAVIRQALAGGFTAFRPLPVAPAPRRETVGAYFARQRAAGLLGDDDFSDLGDIQPVTRRLQ